ncbi:Histidine kinase [Filimonas lacunae]|uniref:Histidine kinase n=1 Tax=Filimonas lacunae TaxID=477680 RepID=A0A173MDE0_9BACT|nr:histidine kinase [Filimonas lacunae]BAV05537.1 autolysin sensor kinase [Filimonas lacunae]SIT20498.1 Histidine kinase [Filimonas lacunae]
MGRNILIRKLILASVITSFILSGYAFSFINVFKLGTSANYESVITVFIRTLLISGINIWTFLRFTGHSEKKNQVLRLVVGFLLCIGLFMLTEPLAHRFYSHEKIPWQLSSAIPSILLQSLMQFPIISSIHEIVILEHEKTKARIENSLLKQSQLESANQLLRQQIHPHFLFNALSMMKSLYKKDVHAGEAYLTHLVSFMRASLTDSQHQVARLKDEVKLCEDYIIMQKIRFDNALHCQVSIPEAVQQSGAVPGFSLQSLIENAIKHNEATEYAPLRITVEYHDGWLTIENNLQLKPQLDTPSRKGLKNLIERYQLLSGDPVPMHQENGLFTVQIKVLPYEDYHHRR